MGRARACSGEFSRELDWISGKISEIVVRRLLSQLRLLSRPKPFILSFFLRCAFSRRCISRVSRRPFSSQRTETAELEEERAARYSKVDAADTVDAGRSEEPLERTDSEVVVEDGRPVVEIRRADSTDRRPLSGIALLFVLMVLVAVGTGVEARLGTREVEERLRIALRRSVDGIPSPSLLFLLVSSLCVRAIIGLACGLGVPISKLLPESRPRGLIFSLALDFFSFFFFPSFSFVFVVVAVVIMFVTFVNVLVLE